MIELKLEAEQISYDLFTLCLHYMEYYVVPTWHVCLYVHLILTIIISYLHQDLTDIHEM